MPLDADDLVACTSAELNVRRFLLVSVFSLVNLSHCQAFSLSSYHTACGEQYADAAGPQARLSEQSHAHSLYSCILSRMLSEQRTLQLMRTSTRNIRNQSRLASRMKVTQKLKTLPAHRFAGCGCHLVECLVFRESGFPFYWSYFDALWAQAKIFGLVIWRQRWTFRCPA